MNWLLITALSCAVVSTSSTCTGANPLVRQLRGCSIGNEVECRRLAEGLEALFGGRSNSADRVVARRLSSAVLRLVRGEATKSGDVLPEGRVLVTTLRQCAAGGDNACNRIATVLAGLFTGADDRLDASTDRRLARALASRIVAIATATDADEIVSRPADVRR